MKKLTKVCINGISFFKTTYSKHGKHCVGVAVIEKNYVIVNTKEKRTTVSFTKEEWDTFILGVKQGHFDNL